MDQVHATLTINAPASAVFDVLADPTSHGSIDGTGWVQEAVDTSPITEAGQVFRMGMYHPNHPDGNYTMHNLVEDFVRPTEISWRPSNRDADGSLSTPGWKWGYTLVPVADGVEVTLTYDWSAVTQDPNGPRSYIGFPPFPPDHLSNSLAHLAELVAARS